MLVERIESYLQGEGQITDEFVLGAIAEATKFSVNRQLMAQRKKPKGLRGSNPGPCARKMAYAFHEHPVTQDLQPRAKITFLTGDLLEIVAATLLKLSGIKVDNTILDEGGQQEGYFDVGNGLMIPCHGDGTILAQPGITDEDILLEIKSTSDFGFKREWANGHISENYLLQHNVYLETFGYNRGVFLVINKNTGHFCEVETQKDPEMVEWARKNYAAAGLSDPDNLPERYEDGTNYGRLISRNEVRGTKLAWGCCLTPDSEVVTPGGIIMPISEIDIGDSVVSSDGNQHTIIGKLGRNTRENESVFELKGIYLRPIKITEDHPILISEGGNDSWIKAKDMTKAPDQRLVYPFNTTVEDVDELTPELLWLLGMFVAEGSYNGGNTRLGFTLNEDEVEYADRLVRIIEVHFGGKVNNKVRVDSRNGNTYRTVRISNSKIIEFISRYVKGTRSYNKYLDHSLMILPTEKQAHLLDGMVCGDGSKLMTRKSDTVVYSTTSKTLAYQYHEIMLRRGRISGISVTKAGETKFGDNTYKSKPCYHIRWYPVGKRLRGSIEGNRLLTPLQYIKKVEYSGEVLDIEVSDIHDFRTVSGIVHNSYCDYLHSCWNIETTVERGKPVHNVIVEESRTDILDF